MVNSDYDSIFHDQPSLTAKYSASNHNKYMRYWMSPRHKESNLPSQPLPQETNQYRDEVTKIVI